MIIRGCLCPSQQLVRYYIRNILHGFIVFPNSSVLHKMYSDLFWDQNEVNVQRSVMELLKLYYILDEKGQYTNVSPQFSIYVRLSILE